MDSEILGHIVRGKPRRELCGAEVNELGHDRPDGIKFARFFTENIKVNRI